MNLAPFPKARAPIATERSYRDPTMARAVVLFVTTAALCLTHTSGAGIIPAFSRPPMFALRQHAALSPVRGGRGDRPRTKSPAMSSAKIEFEDPVAPEPGCYSNVLPPPPPPASRRKRAFLLGTNLPCLRGPGLTSLRVRDGG